MHLLMRIATRLCILLAVMLFFSEFLIYYVNISQCKWPQLTPNAGESVVRSMILADIHMLGPYRGHWADKMWREWQMHRAFQTTMTLHRPEVVFILGDTFDEGQNVNDAEFLKYQLRFPKLFHVPEGVDMYGAVGNHDVGFHYRLHPYLINRFERNVFANPPNVLLTIKNVNFILINSMAMENDKCHLCEETKHDIRQMSKRLKCVRPKWMAKPECEPIRAALEPPAAHQSDPILLQHFPTYRESDAECMERDDENVATTTPFRENWDVLSRNSTDWLAKVLRPRAVFSGHSHQYCRTKTRWGVEEYTVSSFNWRNINNPKFLLAEFTSSQYAVEVCEAPNQSTVVTIYLCGLVAAICIVLVTVLRRPLTFSGKMLNLYNSNKIKSQMGD